MAKQGAKQGKAGYVVSVDLAAKRDGRMKFGWAGMLLLLAGLAAAASACGRRGDLDTPAAAAAEARGERAPVEETVPERGFILDALIE